MTFEQFYKKATEESKVEATKEYVRILWDNAYTIEQAIHNLITMHDDDNYLADNIVEARTNHDKACEVYRNYVGKAETPEERLRRINAFRCGGW